MKLFYYKFQNRFPDGRNFGDDLNPWLWKKLLPGVLDEDENTLFVGIGTLLNENLPKAGRTVVFGTGVGYHKPPNIDDSWTIYCLRGLLSAQALGVSSELAITDGAVLIRRLFSATSSKVHRFAYMPHVVQAYRNGKAWNEVCEQLGFKYIDPRWSIEQVLSAISQTEILLAEAMHGAIVADALRVPWIPIRTSSNILEFKWRDWCSSLGVEYFPREVVCLSDLPKGVSRRASLHRWVKKTQAATQLSLITKTSRPTLSNETHLERLTVQLEEKLQQFKDDVASGYFYP